MSVASQLIEEVTEHAHNESLADARDICADGTYFPNNLRTNKYKSARHAVITVVLMKTRRPEFRL